jgi:hypothetical protein
MPPARLLLLLVLAIGSCALSPAGAEDTDPFRKIDEERARARRAGGAAPPAALPPVGGGFGRPWVQEPANRPAEAPDGPSPGGGTDIAIQREALPPLDERARAVERDDLAPALSADGSGLPDALWQGMTTVELDRLLKTVELPPRSPALAALWRRVLVAGLSDGSSPRVTAHRLEALSRSGLVRETGKYLAGTEADPVVAALTARHLIAAGDRENGCAEAQRITRLPDMAQPVRAEMLLLSGYCAAANGDTGAAGLAAELARGEGADAALPLAALDSMAAGQSLTLAWPRRMSLIDYRFLALAKVRFDVSLLERADASVLAVLADDESVEPALRVVAAEAAARINAIDAERLAIAYRVGDYEQPDGDTGNALRRAGVFRAIEAERTPSRRTRLVRQLLDEGRKAGLYVHTARLLAPAIEALAPVPEIGWFGETAIEINLAAGRYGAARKWIEAAERFDRGGNLQHWLLLADIADPAWVGRRGEALATAEQLAVRGRFDRDLLHRLATALDALDYQIPIPLWEAASRTPQPAGGHLPGTGTLSQLADAAKQKQVARTVLLTLETIGPSHAEHAHIIALGDTIRALRRAGLEPDARRLALEALLAGWPRQAGG